MDFINAFIIWGSKFIAVGFLLIAIPIMIIVLLLVFYGIFATIIEYFKRKK